MARVWRAERDEAAVVAGLLVDFRNWFGRDWPSEESFHESVERLMEDPSTVYLLGAPEGSDEPAGVCQLRFRLGIWHEAEDCWIEDLYVRDEARGGGLGAALAEHAIELALERGCARVELDVNEGNPPALALYEKLGFSAESDPPGGRNLMMRRHLH